MSSTETGTSDVRNEASAAFSRTSTIVVHSLAYEYHVEVGTKLLSPIATFSRFETKSSHQPPRTTTSNNPMPSTNAGLDSVR